MSWSWYIYTTLAPVEVVRIDAAYQAALDAFLQEHDVIDSLPEVGPGGPPPPTPEAVSAYWAQSDEPIDPVILARLAACRTTVVLGYVSGGLQDSPLQVSALRFLLERLAPCVFDWGEYALESGEETLQQLAGAKSRGRLDRPSPKPRPVTPVPRARVRPGQLRAANILVTLSRAEEDRDAQLDLSRAVARMSEPARRYLELILAEGARAGDDAAATLRLAPDALERAIEEIEAGLREL